MIVLPAAVRDIDDQAAYYHDQKKFDTATRWLKHTRRTIELVAANPGLGAHIAPGLRAWRVEKFPRHIIVYRTREGRVEAIHVFHGAADLDRLL